MIPSVPRAWRGAAGHLVRLIGLVVVAAGIGLLAMLDVGSYARQVRGIESGLALDQPPLMTPRLGVNVALEQYGGNDLDDALDAARSAGFVVLRQHARWADLEPSPGAFSWQLWDRLMTALERRDLRVIVVLHTAPDWARPSWEAANPYAPPANLDDLARFASAFARRYRGRVLAYQIWDEPNVAPNWGSGAVDPAGYVAMLRATSAAIREADPEALIIGGGLAPNTESGGRNMSDLRYLHEIYRRGAGSTFDILGVKAYGFWSGPDDRRADADVLNFSRVILLRREMLRRGDAAKPVWALEAGWCALPEDWSGPLPPQGCDTPAVQADRLARAVDRARREWPWMTLVVAQHLQPAAPPDDPAWGMALLDAGGEPTPLLGSLQHALRDDVIYPGLTLASSASPLPAPDGRLRFWGTDLLLQVERGPASGALVVSVDALPGPVRVDLESAVAELDRVRIGRTIAANTHSAHLSGKAHPQALRAVQVGYQPALEAPWSSVVAGLGVLAWAAWRGWREARELGWGSAWRWVLARWQLLPGAAQGAPMTLGLAAMLLAPSGAARLVGLAAYGAGAALRPDLALLAAVAAIPLAPLHLRLGPGSFSLLEAAILVAAAAHGWTALMARPRRNARRGPGRGAALWRWIASRSLADAAVLGLVLLGLVAALHSEYRREALREWRTVMLGAGLLYALLRSAFEQPRPAITLVDVLWLSGTAVALYALARYPLADGAIEAEGVRRARGFFGSPNNLALVLGRLLPLGIVMAWHGVTRRRRWLYGLGAAAMALATVLTFSRGALLLALPAALVYLAWWARSRAARVAAAALVLGAVAAVPLAGVERFASLADPGQGTTFLRLSLWQAAWDMVRDHLWLGVGPDSFLYHYGDYIRPGAEVDRWLSHPHNIILDVWLRLGVGGLAIAGAMAAGLARDARRALAGEGERDARAVTVGLVAGAIASLAHGLIDTTFFLPELAAWWMVALAWCSARARP